MKNSFIIKKIRRVYYRQLLFSALLFAVSLAFLSRFPGENYFFPRPVNSKSHYENFYNRELPYVSVHVPGLSYTGCRQTVNGLTGGYYYYTLYDGFCQFYLLENPAASLVHPTLQERELKGRLIRLSEAEYNALLEYMADGLGWTVSALQKMTAPYAISDLASPFYLDLLFHLLAAGSAALALSDFLCCLFYLTAWHRCPAFRFLGKPEDAKRHLQKADWEAAHDIAAASPPLFITPGYVMALDTERPFLLPLSAVLTMERLPERFWIPGRGRRFRVRITAVNGCSCTLSFRTEAQRELLFRLFQTL